MQTSYINKLLLFYHGVKTLYKFVEVDVITF